MQLYVMLCLEKEVVPKDLSTALPSGHATAQVNAETCSYMVCKSAKSVWIDDDTGRAQRVGKESPRKRICREKKQAIYGMGVLFNPNDSPEQEYTSPATIGNLQGNSDKLFMSIKNGGRTVYFLLRSPNGALIGDVDPDAVCPSIALFDGNLHMFRLRVHQLQAHHDNVVVS